MSQTDIRDAQALLVDAVLSQPNYKGRMIEFLIAETGPRRGQLLTNINNPLCPHPMPTYDRLAPEHRGLTAEQYREALDKWETPVVIFTYIQAQKAWASGKTAREIVDMAYRAIPSWAH